MSQLYKNYQDLLQKIQHLNAATAVLHWDMETYMPPKGGNARGQQIAALHSLAHEMFCAESTGALLQELHETKAALTPEQAANVELSLEDYRKATKLPSEFVKEQSILKTEASQAWMKARETNDYAVFSKPLASLIESKREEARLMGDAEHLYDNLIDTYEKGATVKQLDQLFLKVRKELVAFTQELRELGKPSPADFLRQPYDKDQQWTLGLELLEQMGYNFQAGRQDLSAHPFTISFAAEDVRVTTRVDENDLMSMIGSCIHEGGHALYEQGLPAAQYGLPLGAATSLGIHESQSRLWENNVGMSLPYWKANLNALQSRFPAQLAKVSPQQFYKAINQVAPNSIRIEADELHYHLHVLIRYELEKGLTEGSISTEHLNETWNQLYKEYMGIDIKNDQEGILQDIHWSQGLFGYFPTYSLGSFYAAQFFRQAQLEMPNLIQDVEKGKFSALLDWLRTKIHQHGRRYSSEELCVQICGEGLNVDYFMDYVRQKYRAIYELS